MAALKTKRNDQPVTQFLDSVDDEKKRSDSYIIKKMMEEVTGEPSVMWGDSIVGYGTYDYKYASGREASWMLTGFSPRKQNLTLYIMPGFDRYDELLGKLGKFKTGKSCLYINKLEDINVDVLRELVRQSVAHMKESNPPQG